MNPETIALIGLAAHTLTRLLKTGALTRALWRLGGRGIPHAAYGWIALVLATVIAGVEALATGDRWTAALVHGLLGGVAAIGLHELGAPVAASVGGPPASRALFGKDPMSEACPPEPPADDPAEQTIRGNSDPTIHSQADAEPYKDRPTSPPTVVGGLLLALALGAATTSTSCLPPARTPEEQRERVEAVVDGTRKVLDVVSILVRFLLADARAQDPATRACLEGLVADAEAALDAQDSEAPAQEPTEALGAAPDPCASIER